MLKSLYKFGALLVGVSLFSACKPGVPSGMMKPGDLENLLYDYHMAQAMADAASDSADFRRYSYVHAVLDKYGISEAEFDSTMIWYSTHATYLDDIYKRLEVRYADQVALLGAATGETTDIYAGLDALGDTADIWHERTFSILKPCFAEDKLTFAITPDTTFRTGDSFLWRFDARYIANGKKNDAYAGLYIKYDNDSTAGITRRIYANNMTQLRLGGDTAHAICELGGFIYYQSSAGHKDPQLLNIRNIMLVRFHPEIKVADTTVVDSLAPDTTIIVIEGDSTVQSVADTASRRLSPTELRDSRSVERSINVVKEKPYRLNNRNRRNTRR